MSYTTNRNEKILTVSILGCGNRGYFAYGRRMAEQKQRFRIVALCDFQMDRLAYAGDKLGVSVEDTFSREEDFFEKKRSDLLIIATQDADHVRHCKKALEMGYDVLMEKPITADQKACDELLETQKKYGGKVLVCHVLRYAPAFQKCAQLLAEGAIGQLVEINATEQVAYYHQAHSFVRGNWRREDETSPMILAKCCHDLDLLQFYAGSPCRSVSSVGNRSFFHEGNAPKGCAYRCLQCDYMDTCPYSAKRIYLDGWDGTDDQWPIHVITNTRPITREALYAALEKGPYGRCVFYCDNTVVDHQVSVFVFENGVKASLTMTAFTANGGRIMDFHGTYGEIVLHEEAGTLTLKRFREDPVSWKIEDLVTAGTGHGGGDDGLVDALYLMMTGQMEDRTGLVQSIESHRMAFAAEESRLRDGEQVRIHCEQ